MTERTVVLLHAFPLDHRMWDPQSRALANAGWRVISPDLPGFGGTALPSGTPSLATVADLILTQLEDVESCTLGGVSLGGYVAMAMLRKRRELAEAIVLCGTKASADGEPAKVNRERLAQLVLDEPQDCLRVLEQAVLPGLVGDTSRALRPDVVELIRGWLVDAPAETVAWYQRAMASRPASLDVLSSISVPTLVVWGEEDSLSPRIEQDLMLSRLVDGELAVIESAGHLAQVERPDVVAGVIVDFVKALRPS